MASGIGDEAFAEFARRELPRLVRLARMLTGNDHDAWDLAQDALVRVGLRWKRIDSRRNPGAYAARCVVTLNQNRIRRFRREVLTSTPPEQPEADVDTLPLDAWVDQALQSMSMRQRAAVTLAYLEDLSVRQVADILGCSESAAKTHLSRGREVLRAAARTQLDPTQQPANDEVTDRGHR